MEGGADIRMLSHRDYHLRYEEVEATLAKRHPCNHRCGEKRLLLNYAVMGYRACGETMVKPTKGTKEVKSQPYYQIPMTPNKDITPSEDRICLERSVSETSFKWGLSEPPTPIPSPSPPTSPWIGRIGEANGGRGGHIGETRGKRGPRGGREGGQCQGIFGQRPPRVRVGAASIPPMPSTSRMKTRSRIEKEGKLSDMQSLL